MSFFKVVDNKLKYDMEYILMHKPFKAIIDKYGSSKAEHYFKYIYELTDNRSYSNKQALSKAKAHEHACSLAGFDKDYEPDKVVLDAIKHYKKHNYLLHADTLKELKFTLDQTKQINRKIRVAIDDKLNTEDTLDSATISSLIGLQSKLFSIVDELPSKIEAIKRLEIKVYQELEKERDRARGGAEIPDSYEGDPEIEGVG